MEFGKTKEITRALGEEAPRNVRRGGDTPEIRAGYSIRFKLLYSLLDPAENTPVCRLRRRLSVV